MEVDVPVDGYLYTLHPFQSDFSWETKSGAETHLTIKVPSGDNGDWMFGVAIVAKDNTSGGILFASSVLTNQSHSGGKD